MKIAGLDVVPSGFFAFRTPLLPFDELEAWSSGLHAPALLAATSSDDEALGTALAADRRLLRERLAAFLERPEVHEALFVASPSLVDGLEQWRRDPDGKKGRRAEQSLVRYLVRMASRATPFGLFSGCSTGILGEATVLELAPRGEYRRSTRLDMDYLFALTEELGRDHELRRHLRYHPNSSLYETAGRLRYAEARVDGRLRTYHLVAVESADYLERTLERARDGAALAELAQGLVDDDPDGEISREEAEEFVHELVDAQLLVSDLQPTVTGHETIHELIEQCRGLAPVGHVAERLDATRRTLEELDAGGVGAEPEVYRAVARELEALPAPVDLPRLFQVDMVKPGRGTLGPAVIAELERGVALLHRLFGNAGGDDSLSRFRDAFRKRYEEAPDVPLVEVLDEESGIGFDRIESIGADASPLLKGLPFRASPGEPTVRWSRYADLLLKKVETSLAAGAHEVELEEAEVEAFPADELPPFPDAFHVMATIAAPSAEAVDRGELLIFFRGAGGPSGARLLGRFCHADPELHRHVEAHLRAEEALQEDAIFAEVVHLPEGRLGNILARPRLREWEIPFLGRGAAPASHRLPITDLTVSVAGQRIVLRSRRLGKRILPRLTSAHNFGGRNQGLYRFLCSLQSEGLRGGVGWSWGQMESLAFLPRVRCGRLVLARARWRVIREEIEKTARLGPGPERFRALRRWHGERRMPRRMMLVDGDNELYVDFDNALSVDTLLAVVERRPFFVLAELFPGTDELCARGPEGRFQQEVVVPFVRRPPPAAGADVAAPLPAPPASPPSPRPAPVRRLLPPGSEWLYAKVYCGTSSADAVLREAVAPVVAAATAAGAADGWFFIRYGDPDWHLRLRFHGDPRRLNGEVLPRLQEALLPLVEGGLVWSWQLDTYQREVERYGGDGGIELAEDIFGADSDAALAIVATLAGDEGADARWRLALRGSALLLRDLGLDDDEQLEAARQMQEGFAREFRLDTAFKKELSDRLRREGKELERLLEPTWDPEHPLAPGFEALERRSAALAPRVAELRRRQDAGLLDAPVARLASSFVHMFNNRLLRSQGRAHEVVIYDFLHQLLRSRALRARHRRKG